jgi:hypothetical protein
MKHSLRHNLVMIFSIFAMLLSNYVSSAPAMALSSLQNQAVSVVQTSIHQNEHQHKISETGSVTEHHASHNRTSCHSMNDNTPNLDSNHQSPSSMSHCGDSESSVDDCCASVCSSVSYPNSSYISSVDTTSSLALHHPVKIGDKVARIQGLLRPPSA